MFRIRIWTQVSWDKRTFWFWMRLTSQGWQRQRREVFQFEVPTRFRVCSFWVVFHFKVRGYRVRRWFLPRRRTYPFCFDRGGQLHRNSCRFWSWHQFTCLLFTFFWSWWVFCQRVPWVFRGSTSLRCSIVFWLKKCSNRCLLCWLLGWQSFLIPGRPLLWTHPSFPIRILQWTSFR